MTNGKGEVSIVRSDTKYRITIPKRIRNILDFKTGQLMLIIAIEDSVVVKPVLSNMNVSRTLELAKKVIGD